MADHRRREESTPLVPPRSLGGRHESRDEDDSRWSGHGQTQTQEQPAARSGDTRPDRDDSEAKTSPLAMAAAAVASAKQRAMGPSPRPEGVARSEDQLQAASAARPGRTRRARLRLVRLDPWSVMKTAFLLSIAFGIMCVVAVFIIWSVLGAANVFDSINATVGSVLSSNGAAGEEFAIQDYIGMDRVLSFTMLMAVLDVVLITAIATLGAFLYNLAASLLGGLELTLAEDDH